jgi:hypothetical protein
LTPAPRARLDAAMSDTPIETREEGAVTVLAA